MRYSEDLLGRQNADGGWSYHRGGSWTEPTCYALLALSASGASHTGEVRRGVEWLRRCQRADGGLAPRESVPESTWLTALALLLPAGSEGIDRPGRGLDCRSNWPGIRMGESLPPVIVRRGFGG